MKVGYARISTLDQNLALQEDALTKAGCEKIFTDTASGAQDRRQGLADALAYARDGDTLVVWKLDRLGRSLKHLIATVSDLAERKIGFLSLTEGLDTLSSGGKLVFHIFGALAEFERSLIRERTQAGLTAARARGRMGGRPMALVGRKLDMARRLVADPSANLNSIAETLGVSRSTLYRNAVAAEKALSFEPLNPNGETIAAMKAARRGDLIKAGKPKDLLRSLNAGDGPQNKQLG